MSKTTMVMVYSATSEAEVARQYAASAAEAESRGYVPISETWDNNTLTVTYQYRDHVGRQTIHAQPAHEDSGLWSRLSRRIGSR